jgi:hypothetical protein
MTVALLSWSRASWDVKNAYPQQQTCEKVLEAVWREDVAHWKRQGLFKLTWKEDAIGFYSLNSEWVQYVCLPDTVDPRGPKGK